MMITLTVEDEMAKFEMFQDKSGEHRWRLRATNQQIIASSGEGYKSKESCRSGIEAVKRDAASAEIVELAAAPK